MSELSSAFEHISDATVVDLLSSLVRIPSYNPPGKEQAMAESVAGWLGRAGLPVELQPATTDRSNVIARIRGDGTRQALLLCAHLDTVPPGEATWSHDPLGAEIVNGRLYGRGAMDTKGSLAAMMMAAQTIRSAGLVLKGDLVFLATVDEESAGLGAQAFVHSGGMAGVGGMVIGEPTSLDFVIAHRGSLWLELATHGKTAHGAMPEQGVNAILPMAEILQRLAAFPFTFVPHRLLPPPTINIATIEGGVKTNMVPDLCRATADMRTVPGQRHETIVRTVRELVAQVTRQTAGLTVTVEVTHDKVPLETSEQSELIDLAKHAAQAVLGRTPRLRGAAYTTDGSDLSRESRPPALICGPGSDGLAHQVDEYVELEDVVTAARLYTALAITYLT